MNIKDFKIIKSIGEGAFGEVYLVKNNLTGQQYALKCIEKSFLYKQRKEHHVFQEKLILHFLDHPSVVKLYGTFQDDKKLYFLMDYLEKGELAGYLNRKKVLDLEEIRYLTAQIVLILEYIHSKGIIHRDLKPENLIFDSECKLKLIDFGTADIEKNEENQKIFEKYEKIREKYTKGKNSLMVEEQKSKKSFVGTVYYIAPEMLVLQDVDKGCDLWALGIIIYKMLTGKYLFNQANDYLIFQEIKNGKYEMQEGIDEIAKDLISQLLRPIPKERLGNGDPDSGRTMSDLKKHKFFEKINFENLLEKKSPIVITKDSVDSSSDEDFKLNSEAPLKKTIIMTGLVKKMKYILMYNTRQLILYSNGTLEYFDPKKSEFKGKIHITKECKVFSPSKYIFHLKRPEREYVFNCVDVLASKWVQEIKFFIKHQLEIQLKKLNFLKNDKILKLKKKI